MVARRSQARRREPPPAQVHQHYATPVQSPPTQVHQHYATTVPSPSAHARPARLAPSVGFVAPLTTAFGRAKVTPALGGEVVSLGSYESEGDVMECECEPAFNLVRRALLAAAVVVLVVLTISAVAVYREARAASASGGVAGGASGASGASGSSVFSHVASRDAALDVSYADHRAAVDAHIEAAARAGRLGRHRLGDACARALRGGKRLRAVIALEVARCAGAPRGAALEAASAVEYLHAASLVIDDTPAFDNDATRRGAPALHAAVGEGVAQMAAVSLVAAAFRALADQGKTLPARDAAALVAAAADAMGGEGAAAGQVLDISTRAELAAEGAGVEDLVRLKTASFFELAAVAGWLAARGAPASVPAVRAAGARVGYAFQIADDIGDAARDAARAAAAGRGGWNYANELGPESAWRALAAAQREGRAALSALGLWSGVWEEIYAAIAAMTADGLQPNAPTPEPPAQRATAPEAGAE